MIAEQILDLFRKGFIEMGSLGLNASTLGLVGSLTFAVLGGIGQRHQLKLIRAKGSSAGVSVHWTLAFAAMFSAILLYALERRSLGLLVTCLIRIGLYAPILVALWKANGRFTFIQIAVSVVYSALLVYMIIQSHRESMFYVFNAIGIGMTVTQPIKMWVQRTVGVFSLKMLVMYSGSVVFWLIYDLGYHVPGLAVVMWGFAVVYAFTGITYFVWRNRPPSVPAVA